VRWKKLGQLYDAKSISHPKLCTHAANPLPVCIDGNDFRIFFSGRDASNRSSVGFVDVDIVARKVLRVCEKPVFEHGQVGSFYSHGVSIGSVYVVEGRAYILFMGWQVPENGHWRGDVGRLELHTDLTLTLMGDGPFMASDTEDPISLSYPCVINTHQNVYQMLYGSTISWDAGNGEMTHLLKRASSVDGRVWKKHGVSVPYEIGVAQAFSRPTIIGSEANGFHMWFSYRSGSGESYRIGYASSPDCQNWNLKLAESGITVSKSDWDSEMIEYPYVFDHDGKRYMLYNGNGYGKTGFGIAILEQD
jgi:hypothetical protein